MLLLLILPILISGFIVLHIHPVYFYKLHRYEGQYLYLRSAQLGFICFLVSSLLALTFSKYFPDSLFICSLEISFYLLGFIKSLLLATDVFDNNKNESALQFSWIILITILTLLYPYLWRTLSLFWLRLKYRTNDAQVYIYIMSNILKDSPLDELLFKASYTRSMLLMLSLSNRKVYVGKIMSMGEPNETEGPDQEITIIPVVSGYREEENLKVKLLTNYKKIDEDIGLTIRQSEIISATHFTFDAYLKLK